MSLTLPPEQSNPPATPVLTVSALNRLVRQALEQGFALLRVSGEISNLVRAASGHVYFTLKDAQAQVRCTMWRNKAQLLGFRPENGMQVETRALVTLYETRGDFQLSVEHMRQAGAGDLFEAFLRCKARLEAEGLFSPAHKRALPHYPRRVGIITSPAAAALHDVIVTLRRRAPHLQLVLYPAAVQGDTAPQQLRQALVTASARAAHDQVDLILLVRGGGSLEDLWAFNDEALARAIRASSVPVISGVGHETDFTVADFAADVRAATPTVAAELASAGYDAARLRLGTLGYTLQRHLQRRLEALAQGLDRVASRLRHPRERLAAGQARCAQLDGRLLHGRDRLLERQQARLALLALRLRATRPDPSATAAELAALAVRLAEARLRHIGARREHLGQLARQLELLSPDAVLARGYSITRDRSGRILSTAAGLMPGDVLSIRLSQGQIDARIETIRPDEPN